MQVLTVRTPDEIIEAIEKIVAVENRNPKSRFDPREIGRGVVVRHLLALGVAAWESERRKNGAAR